MNKWLENILALPENAIVNTPLTKQFFYKNFDLTNAEKKLFKSNIVEMNLLGSISENTSNITSVKTPQKTFENIFVITIDVTAKDFHRREIISSTIQKYFPYHCLIIIQNPEEFIINAASKRINQNDNAKRVVIDEVSTPVISKLISNPIQSNFVAHLDFKNLDKTNLKTLYESYFSILVNFKASVVTNKIVTHSKTRTQKDIQILTEIDQLESQVLQMNNLIDKEKRTNTIVELNTKRWRVKEKINGLKNKLT